MLTSVNTLLPRLHLLILSKMFHQLGTKNSNIWAYGGHSHSKPKYSFFWGKPKQFPKVTNHFQLLLQVWKISDFSILKIFNLFMWVHACLYACIMCEWGHMQWQVCEGQRTTLKSSSLLLLHSPGKAPGLHHNTLTSWALLPATDIFSSTYSPSF